VETVIRRGCLLLVAGVLVTGWWNHNPEMLVIGGIYAAACLILLRLDMDSHPDSGK
jgi:hypothetical protein